MYKSESTSMASSEHAPRHGIWRAVAKVWAKTIPTRSPVNGPGPIPTTTWSISLLTFKAAATNLGRASACAVAPS